MARSMMSDDSPTTTNIIGNRKPITTSRLQRNTNRSSMMSWADPNDVSQMLDFAARTPVTTLKTGLAEESVRISTATTTSSLKGIDSDHSFRGWSFDQERTLDPKRPTVGYSPSSLLSPRSKGPLLHTPSPKQNMPLKAQRLMGLDSPTVYMKSGFDEWDDEEERRNRQEGSPLSRKTKGESRSLFKTPPKSKSRLSETVSTTQFPSISDDIPTLHPVNRDSPGSRWVALGQRLRSSSSTPVVARLKKSESSPTTSGFFDKNLDRESLATKATSVSRTSSMSGTPTNKTSFSPELHRKLSQEGTRSQPSDSKQSTKTLEEKIEWAEARASSRALNNSIDGSRTKELSPSSKKSADHPQLKEGSYGNSSSSSIDFAINSVYHSEVDLPLQVIRSTPPLRFNPTRRPRAPFPPADQSASEISNTDEVKSSVEGKGCLSPPLPPCPDKMQVPSRMMRLIPPPPAKVEMPPTRPRRPTESNIFTKPLPESKVEVQVKPTSPIRRSVKAPPKRPPPNIPIPPLPSALLSLQVEQGPEISQLLAARGKTKGLMVALGMQTPSPLPESAQQQQPIFDRSKIGDDHTVATPNRVVFCGAEMEDSFSATLIQLHNDSSISSDVVKVELIVGGVSFETQASLLLDGVDESKEGLVKWFNTTLEQKEKEKLSDDSKSLEVPTTKSSARTSAKSSLTNSTLDSFSSSEEEEDSEEEHQTAFTYQMSPISHPQWTLEEQEDEEATEKLLTPIQHLQLASPFRSRRAHARTPTNVSSDADSNEEGEEESYESSNIDQDRRISATPDLVSSAHTFIFTAESPSPPALDTFSKEKMVSTTRISSIQIQLNRDPQTYPFILHLLKHKTLPTYFSMGCIPVEIRMRSLHSLSREFQWLGYTNLVKLCDEHFEKMEKV